jgi:hypothetical protein
VPALYAGEKKPLQLEKELATPDTEQEWHKAFKKIGSMPTHAAKKLGRPRLLLYRNQDVRLLIGTLSVPPYFEKLVILSLPLSKTMRITPCELQEL